MQGEPLSKWYLPKQCHVFTVFNNQIKIWTSLVHGTYGGVFGFTYNRHNTRLNTKYLFFQNAFTLEMFPVALNPLENVTNKKRQKKIYIYKSTESLIIVCVFFQY